jgi:hypothetical protein
MGLQHRGRDYDSATLFKHMRFKHMSFKHMRFKLKRQRCITQRCRNLSEPSGSLRASHHFGGSVSLKLENFQDVT